MKRLKRWWFGHYKHKYVNGGRGVITIFLAALMLPFLGFADYIVEMGRYHEAAALLDEAMDSAALSTLANYDSYLKNRFGLLALSQEDSMQDITASYLKYVQDNIGGYHSWSDINVTMNMADYSLADDQILMQEIAEFSKFSVPTALAGDFTQSILEDLFGNFGEVQDWAGLIGGYAEAASSTVTLAKEHLNVNDATKQIETDIGLYSTAYDKFKNAVTSLTQAVSNVENAQATVDSLQESIDSKNTSISDLETERGEIEQDYGSGGITQSDYNEKIAAIDEQISSLNAEKEEIETEKSDADSILSTAQTNLSSCQNEYDNAKKSYSDAITKLKKDYAYFKERIEALDKAVVDVGKNIQNAATAQVAFNDKKESQLNEKKKRAENMNGEEQKAEKEKLEAEIHERETEIANVKASAKAQTNGMEAYSNEIKEALEGANGDFIENQTAKLTEILTKVDSLEKENIGSSFQLNESEYYSNDMKTPDAQKLIELMEQKDEEAKESTGFSALIEMYTTVFDSLFSSSLIFDRNLSAYLKRDLGTSYTPTELDLVLQSIQELTAALKEGVIGFFTGVNKVSDIMQATRNLICNIGNYIKSVAVRAAMALKELFSGEVGGKFLLDQYLVRSLPNRTDIKADGTMGGTNALTGYSYAKVPFEKGDAENSIVGLGDLEAVLEFLGQTLTDGKSEMFSGAELEYILVGSRSEVLNQVVVFWELYLVRLITTGFQVYSNSEVIETATVAGAAFFGIGAPAVHFLEVLLNPLIDTLFLVNGKTVKVIKPDVYLTPSGVSILVKNLISLGLTKAQEENLKEKFQENIKTQSNSEQHDESVSNAEELDNKKEKTTVDLSKDKTGQEIEKEVTKNENEKGIKDSLLNVKWGYDDYLFVLMLLFGENTEYLQRFRNLVSLEAAANYKKSKQSFNIEQSYVFISATANADYKIFLPLDNVSKLGFVKVSRTRMRGY